MPRRSSVHALLAATVLLAACGSALGQATTQPVQFLLTGEITDDGQQPLNRAQITILRSGTSEVLAERVFTGSDGVFATSFQAEILIEVGLGDSGDPVQPGPSAFDGFWMGEIWPNPYRSGQRRSAAIPYAAPSRVQGDPRLEMFDSRGRRIREGDVLSSGVYFYRLRFDHKITGARKLIVLGATRAQFGLERVAAPEVVQAKRQGSSTFDKAEGELDVDVIVQKDGYVTHQFSANLDSRLDNQTLASLTAEAPPTAQLLVSGSLVAGEAVLFDGAGSTSPDGQDLRYSWEFGDGTRGGGEALAHVFSQAGTYTAELTVRSTYGATHTTSQEVIIGAGTAPATTNASSVGTVRDAVGNLLEGVTVSLVDGVASAVTDAQGSVTLTGLPTGVPLALLCEKSGYTTQVIRLILPANTTDSEFGATLRRRRAAVPVAAVEDGFAIEGSDGVCLEMPADAMQESDGTPASGSAGIRLTPVDMTDPLESAAFPGAYEGVLADGGRGLIVSYGVAEFVIEQGGEELQLRPGTTAFVEIPIYTPGAVVDDQIALWSVDESTGLWTEEGLGTVVANDESPTGLALRAEVTHFSWWNCDQFLGAPYRVIPDCKIVDNDGLPTLELPVGDSCYIEGELLSSSGPTSRPSISIPPGGGIPIDLPPDVDVQLTASASNGLKRGVAIVNGPSDAEDDIVIGLDDPDGSPDELTLPADFDATIDPAGEVDRYTFDAVAGQYFSVFVERAVGSMLSGDVRLLAPGDVEIATDSFGGLAASLAHEVLVTGTYAIEIDGTDNEPGAYHIVVQFSEPYDMEIDDFVEDELHPGQTQVFLISLELDDIISLNYQRRETFDFSRNGLILVESPSGAVILDHGINSDGYDSGLIRAQEAGIHRVYLTSTGIDAVYTFHARGVPEIPLGGLSSGLAEYKSTQYYRFVANAGDFVRSSAVGSSFTPSVSFIDENNNQLQGSFLFPNLDGTPPVAIQSAGEYFVRLGASFGGVRTVREFQFSLNDVRPPALIALDAFGRGQVSNGQVGLFGDMRLFQFDANAGDGVALELRAGSVSTLNTQAVVALYRIGGGDYRSPDEQVQQDFIIWSSGEASLGILEFAGYELPATGTYMVAVQAPAPTDGGFELVLDVVSSSATLTVDDDIADCPTADTRSLIAAAMAAPAGGTINVCPGTYSNIVPIPIQKPGISLLGSSQQEVTLRREGRGFAIYATEAPNQISDLTVEASDPVNSTGIYLRGDSGGLVQDVLIRAAVTSSDLDVAIEVDSSPSGLVLRRITAENTLRALEGDADGLLVEDCLFDGGTGLIELQGDAITLQNNVWNCTEIGRLVEIENGAGHQILNNVITVSTTDIGGNLKSPAIYVEDEDNEGTAPATVVRGNEITTNEAGFDLRLTFSGSEILCEQNLVKMTARGQTALVIIPQNDAGQTAIIRNNVFDGLNYYRGVHIRWADWYGSLDFVNNTMRTDTQGTIQPIYPTVLVDLRPGSTFTGALSVLLANNVIQGPGGSTAAEIPASTTLDSDYNLIDGYATYYADGTTSSGGNDILGQDPLIVGPLLELDPTSPGVDSGAGSGDITAVPSVDYDGTSRPQGPGTDRGAHEQ